MKTLTIIDTFGFFFRSFYALPPLKNKEGFPTGLLLGFCNLLNSLYKDKKCDYIIFALEGQGKNRRKILDPRYKQNRQEVPKDLLLQLPIAIEWISKMGFVNLSVDGYEADDVIASASVLARQKDLDVRIISHDKDLYQLIDSHTYIYDPIKKIEIREEQCQEKFGVLPCEFIDYQSLVGDSSDNVCGVKGVGAKSAQKLIKHFKNIESLYARSDEIAQVLTPRLQQVIVDSKDEAFLSKALVTLVKDIPLNIDFAQCAMPEQNPLLQIVDALHKYEFNGILTKIQGPKYNSLSTSPNFKNATNPPKHHTESTSFVYEYEMIDSQSMLFALIDSIPKDALVAFDTESDGLDTKEANIVGFSFSFDKTKGYYVPLQHTYLGVQTQLSMQDAKIAIQKLFAHTLIGHNLKFDIALV
uniref:5'-3' exonuclease H3TH domain-containing protein n=1 Tax=uncultured Helicobacter sp. TaxID=175537 RepID=UPI00374E27C4